MKIQILSDLHFEFDPDGGETFIQTLPINGRVLVLAGDILPMRDTKAARQMFGRFCRRFQDVVYVPGNHEYYGTSPAAAHDVLGYCAANLANLHILNPGVTTIAGQRFVGATLWFPEMFDGRDRKLRRYMNDFRVIDDFVPWVFETHAAHLAFLDSAIQSGDVVVTHHLPHPASVAPQFMSSALNRFFLADDAAPLVDAGAKLWIHGHTHHSCDYMVGATRVVCNPRGYTHELNQDFDPGLTVTI